MGGPISSYAAAGIALEYIGAHKPPHPATKFFRQGGDTIEGFSYLLHVIDSVFHYKSLRLEPKSSVYPAPASAA
jgi:hypothetical protein